MNSNKVVNKDKNNPSWAILQTHKMTSSQLANDSLVGRVLHRHLRGHGFESHSSLNFFQAFFLQLLKLRT